MAGGLPVAPCVLEVLREGPAVQRLRPRDAAVEVARDPVGVPRDEFVDGPDRLKGQVGRPACRAHQERPRRGRDRRGRPRRGGGTSLRLAPARRRARVAASPRARGRAAALIGSGACRLAEGAGFEPATLAGCGFQDRRLQPLGHPSTEHLTPFGRSGVRLFDGFVGNGHQRGTGPRPREPTGTTEPSRGGAGALRHGKSGVMRSRPPMYGRRTSGTVTLPSASW